MSPKLFHFVAYLDSIGFKWNTDTSVKFFFVFDLQMPPCAWVMSNLCMQAAEHYWTKLSESLFTV